MQISQEKLKFYEENYIHLHVHNSLSFKDGVGKPEERINWTVKNNKKYVSTSNHGNICDWQIIFNKSKALNLTPILGCEFYFNRDAEILKEALKDDSEENIKIRKNIKKNTSHITMFAKNIEGYYNMIRIHNDAWLNCFYRNPITSPETIRKNRSGIICLSGCSGSEINRIITNKTYLQSEKRIEDINNIIDVKIKQMILLFKNKKINENDDLDDYDIDYFKSNNFFNETYYKNHVENIIKQIDLDCIHTSDEKIESIINYYKSLFRNNFFIELMVIDYEPQKNINEELIKLSKKYNIKTVLTNDSHYIEKSGAKVQQLQMLNGQDKTFDDLKSGDEKIWTIKSDQLYYKSVLELYNSWKENYCSEIFTEDLFWKSIENVCFLVSTVENYEIDKTLKLPKLSDNSDQLLLEKINNGFKIKNLDQKYLDQALYEFDIIKQKGFVDYFLIVEEMVSWAKENYGKYAVGPGRGSAAGSVVNYLLSVTEVDPLKHNLMFERFLDVERYDPVDIDVDFMPNIRDNVINHLAEKYGRNFVANICTFSIAKTKVALQDVCRVHGIPSFEVLQLTTSLEEIDDNKSLEEIEKDFPQLKEFFNKWNQYDLRFYINQIRGTHRQVSMHASGVLVSSNSLYDNIALMKSKSNIITGWQEGSDYRELSDIGYWKFDILGLSNLNVLDDSRKLILNRHNVDIDWTKINMDDESIFNDIVHNEDYYGIFQFESPLGRKVLNSVKPTTFDELAAISAILRPGPLQMGMDAQFANRKNLVPDTQGYVWKKEDIPLCIRDILGPTQGVLAYQEQYMNIVNKIGGQSKAETNSFRKLITKKSKTAEGEEQRKKKIDSYHDKFLKIASLKENIGNIEESEKIWQLIISMASYSFNASHAISYTYISYRQFWLKKYYNIEFNVSLLNNTEKNKEDRGTNLLSSYISEIINKGYKVVSPKINDSFEKFSINSNNEIVWGLSMIKGMSNNVANKIIEERNNNGKYKDINDFFNRIKPDKSALDCLIWTGAFDGLDIQQESDIFGNCYYKSNSRTDIHEFIFKNLRNEKKYIKIETSNNLYIEKEKEYMELSFIEIQNFIDKRKYILDKTKIKTTLLTNCSESGKYTVFGIVETLTKKKTKSGKEYYSINLKDESGELKNISIWLWKTNIKNLSKGKTGVFTIEIDKKGFKSMLSYIEI